MSLSSRLKGYVELLPVSVSKPLVCVPFTLRLGSHYPRTAAAIRSSERLSADASEQRSLSKLRALLRHAVANVAFYREHYHAHGFTPDDVRCLEDVAKIPIVTKADLQSVPLESRCAVGRKGMHINTGGTSGQPLEFQIDRHAFAREWAHMHHLWKARGYHPRHVKLTFRGKHFDTAQPLRYNAVHNEYVVNANSGMYDVVAAVLRLQHKTVIRWLHGYPSLIAEFSHAVRSASELSGFRSRLFGVLLGSEYPAPAYRSAITNTLTSNIVSWYGHSEMAVLARETAEGTYASYPTYGYAEAVPGADEGGHRLVCTSLHNWVHPFIRYDTGDLIEPVSQSGGALSFRIREGRVGDFVLDRRGRKLALTAIIFGRHHDGFSLAQHVQVRDDGQGRITLLVTPRECGVDAQALRDGFDLGDLDIDLRIELIDAPVRTAAGKIRLKIDPSTQHLTSSILP